MDSKSYEAMVRDAAAIADLFLDHESGHWGLVMLCAAFQAFIDAGELNAAALLYKTAFVVGDIQLVECTNILSIELLRVFLDTMETCMRSYSNG